MRTGKRVKGQRHHVLELVVRIYCESINVRRKNSLIQGSSVSSKFAGNINKLHDYLASKIADSGRIDFTQAYRKN